MRGVAAAVLLVFTTLLPVLAQGNVPPCVATCIATASQDAGCESSSDWKCMCGVSSFHSIANRCITGGCSPSDAQNGEDMISAQCKPNAITSFSVTNSETSPPQQSGEPSVTRPSSITLVPPTPPPSSPVSSSTVTSTPPATITATQPPVIGASSEFPSSFSSLTSDVGTSTEGNVTASGSLTGTGSSGTQQPGASGTPAGNGARTVGIRGGSLLATLFGAASVWAFL